jgi:Ni,Fe-hydrogenase I large subunit
MARGLLVHWLRVDAQGRVERYGVLAPTEWNFHPQGAAAQVLSALDAKQPAPQLAAAAAVLVAAFDPCVDYELAPARDDAEVACA